MGRFIEYKIQGQFTKYYRGTLKNVTGSYAGGLQNTTNRVGSKNTTSTATCLGIVGSVAMVLESVNIEVRLGVLPLVQTLGDGNNPNLVPLHEDALRGELVILDQTHRRLIDFSLMKVIDWPNPLVALFKCNLSGHVPDEMVRQRCPLHDVIVDVVLPGNC